MVCSIENKRVSGQVTHLWRTALPRLTRYGEQWKIRPSLVVFLDLAMAFYTVNHALLLDKIVKFWLPWKLVRMLVNYLRDRQQLITPDGVRSSVRLVNDYRLLFTSWSPSITWLCCDIIQSPKSDYDISCYTYSEFACFCSQSATCLMFIIWFYSCRSWLLGPYSWMVEFGFQCCSFE